MSRFETYIKDHYQTQKNFALKIDSSISAISKWIRGVAFPSPEHIRKIWSLTKGEIGPMYWYVEWPSDVRLKNESHKLLLEKKSRSRNRIRN